MANWQTCSQLPAFIWSTFGVVPLRTPEKAGKRNNDSCCYTLAILPCVHEMARLCMLDTPSLDVARSARYSLHIMVHGPERQCWDKLSQERTSSPRNLKLQSAEVSEGGRKVGSPAVNLPLHPCRLTLFFLPGNGCSWRKPYKLSPLDVSLWSLNHRLCYIRF